jgi:hypothetical protein
MLAVTAGALALFTLALAAVLSRAGAKQGFRLAVAAAIALAVSGAGLAIAGAIRWRDCYRTHGQSIRPTPGRTDSSGRSYEQCPERTLGLRDPF